MASLRQLAAQGRIDADELTVAFITGAGFKTLEAVTGALDPALEVDATMESFEHAYRAVVAAGGS